MVDILVKTIPIVDRFGCPTQEFMIKWQQLAANLASLHLDAIGSTQGDILYRGAANWLALAPGTAGWVLHTGGPGADPQWTAAGSGTMTSVALTMPAEFTVSGSPVTTTGTLAVTKADENANLVYAGPASGSAAQPTFRALVAADTPDAGTVTSVALSAPAEFTVGGSPVTSSGTLTLALANEAANEVWAGPVSGPAAAPTFRALVADDLPLSTADDVSAVLDKIGAAQGDILYRGASYWAVLAPGTDDYVLTTHGSGANPSWLPGGSGSGSVTSVALAAPVEFTVSGSPVTSTGTLTFAKADESANTVWAGPTSGSAAAPTFRALVTADIPGGLPYGDGTVTSVALSAPTEFSVSGSPVTGSGTLTFSKNHQNANLIYAGPGSGTATDPVFRALVPADLPLSTAAEVSAVLDAIGSTEGGVLYRGASEWSDLAIGAANDILSVSSSLPAWKTLSALFDAVFGAVSGQLLYRGASSWSALAYGTDDEILAVVGGEPAWATLSSAIDAAIGGTRGDILYRGASGWSPLAPGASGDVLTTLGAGADPIWSSGGLSRGLWSGLISALPTRTGTGLSTWINQDSSTYLESAVGLSIQNSGIGGGRPGLASLVTTGVPATPYVVTALLSITANSGYYAGGGIGWYDGASKFQTINLVFNNGSFLPYIEMERWSSPTNFVSTNTYSQAQTYNLWLAIQDTGSVVNFSVSNDGINFYIMYSENKSGGYLGSSGYSNLAFCLNLSNNFTAATLMSWEIS